MSNMISVIIPIYNVEKYLSRCLDSVLNQTYENLEIILVDDGSTDNCGKICDEYAKKDIRIKVIHKENGGVSSARNAGLDIANGDYIGFVDSDDYIENDMYSRLYNNMITYNSDVSICGFSQVSYECQPTLQSKTKHFIDVHDNISGMINMWTGTMYQGHMCNKLFKRNLFDGNKFDIRIKMLEDLLMCVLVFMNAKKIVYESIPLYNYVRHKKSVTCKGFTEAKFTAYFAFEQMEKAVKNKHPDLIKYVNFNKVHFSAYLLSLLYHDDFDNKHLYMKKIGKKMKEAINKECFLLIKSKTLVLCVLLNFIHVKATYIVFWLKNLIKTRESIH